MHCCLCLQVKRALKGKAECQTVWGHTMYHPEDVPYKLDMSDLPDTFTPARHKVSKALTIVSPLALLTLCSTGKALLKHGSQTVVIVCDPQICCITVLAAKYFAIPVWGRLFTGGMQVTGSDQLPCFKG